MPNDTQEIVQRRRSLPDLTFSEESTDGRPSSPSLSAAPEAQLMPSRAPTPPPDCDDENFISNLWDWTSNSKEKPRATSPPHLGLDFLVATDNDDKDLHAVSAASPNQYLSGLAPETSEHYSVPEPDADTVTRAYINAAADAYASDYSFKVPESERISREVNIPPLWLLHEEGPCPEYTFPESLPAPMQYVDPRNADIVVPPSPEPASSPPHQSAGRQSKKRKRGGIPEAEVDDSDAVKPARKQKKSKNANSSGPSGGSRRKAKGVVDTVQSNPLPLQQPHVATTPAIKRIAAMLTVLEFYALLDISQIWRPVQDGQLPLAPDASCEALAIRPSRGGNNGRALTTKKDVESLVFSGCNMCEKQGAQSSKVRHALRVPRHYPRIREHALPKAMFTWYFCDACHYSQERKDSFESRHGEKVACGRHGEDASAFCYRLEDPSTREKAEEHIRGLREGMINSHIARLKGQDITDEVVAEVMDSWDVVPDRICAVLQNARYYCFTEADIKARDDAYEADVQTA